MLRHLLVVSLLLAWSLPLHAADHDGNRLAYLNGPVDPYYPHREFAKLTTPQWVGEEGVDCVVTLGIDDMRDTAKYETYLRPILDRLKKIDGRAPVSIMTCNVSPDDPQLSAWLKEGLSIECHTVDHPCPCLQKSDFAAAKGTFDRCVDLMFKIPGNYPVAFRMPCCDSLNTPSPRFWEHAFNDKTAKGNFLAIDSSVFNVITGNDESLPREIRFNSKGEERFRRYIPFSSFVNTINDYPYPYVIGGACWEFPCVVPSDWSAQHVQKPNNPDTLRDWMYALDAIVARQGTFNLVFHPHGWIRAEQIVELIDYADRKYGKRVKFLTFHECEERLTKNLLHGHPLRSLAGNDNGVRVLDVNSDGRIDVIVANNKLQMTYVWDEAKKRFEEFAFPINLKAKQESHLPLFGVSKGQAIVVANHDRNYVGWQWSNEGWKEAAFRHPGIAGYAFLKDVDADGETELIFYNKDTRSIQMLRLQGRAQSIDWRASPPWNGTPERLEAAKRATRLVDVNGDRKLDFVYSDAEFYFASLFQNEQEGWTDVEAVSRRQPLPDFPTIPPFIRADGTNNGAWLHSGKLWWQNEDTAKLLDLVDRVALKDLAALAEHQSKIARQLEESKAEPITIIDQDTPGKELRKQQELERRKRLAKQEPIPVGAAKVDITPDYKVRLAGYAARKTEHEGVQQRIFARAVAIGGDEENGPAVIVSVENCGVPASMIDASFKLINEKVKLPRERLVVSSTHTHSAPWVNGFAPLIFPYDLPEEERKHVDRYTEELTAKIAEAVLAAIKNRKPARLFHSEVTAKFARNRRNKPAPGEGPVDHRVPLIVARDEETHRPLAILFNYACHNTTLTGGWNQIDGDWSGYAMGKVEELEEGLVALSTIGCGADSNPDPRGSLEQAKEYGHSLGFDVRTESLRDIAPISHQLTCKLTHVDLPWTNIPAKEEFEKRANEPGIVGYHAKHFLKKLADGEAVDKPLSYPVSAWTFGDDLAMVFLAGEVVVDYSIALHDRYEPGKLWVSSYSNDVPCYIPSKRILQEGGYEAESSLLYYGRPGQLSPDAEEIILDAVQKLLPYSFGNAERKVEFPPPKDTKEALESFRLPKGFKIELVASEPLVIDPVAFDWGADGSLWVVEMRDYPLGIDGKGTLGGRVKHLYDDNGDGKYDRANIVLDGIPYPTGIKAWRNGVLVSAAPAIFYAEDTTGDDKADKRETLYRGFGEGNQQHRVNGLRWGLDNWLYVGNGDSGGEIESVKTGKRVAIGGRDLRIRPDTGELEAQSGQTQFGRERDDWGNWFGGNNSNPMWHYTLDDHYLRRNPHVPSPDVRKQVSVTPGNAQIFPASKTLMRFNDFHTANRFTSACSPMIYRDHLLGEAFYGNAFVCEPVHNLVHREVIIAEGATFTSRRAPGEEETEFLASTDNWFRPSMVRTGPDGALWMSDMYRFVIEHPTWIPQAWQRKLDLRAGEDKGRIYRVYHEDRPPRKIENLAGYDTGELVGMLNSPNGWQRDKAQELLVLGMHESAEPLLRKLLTESKESTARLHALCTLEGLSKLTEADVIAASKDEHPAVRRHAVRCAERFLDKSKDVLEAVINRRDDVDPFVRVQTAYTLGESSNSRAISTLALILSDSRDNPTLTAAALSSVRQDTLGELLAWLFVTGKEPPPAMERLLAVASALGDAKAINTAVEKILSDSDAMPELWQLRAMAALLESTEKNARLQQGLSEASKKGLDRLAAHVKGLANEGEADEQIVAVRLLARLGEPNERLAQLRVLLDAQRPLEIQEAAATALAQLRDEKANAVLLENWTSKTPALRSRTLELLLSTDDGAKVILSAIEKQSVPSGDLDIRRRQQLLAHKQKEIRQLAAKLIADKVDADRAKVIEQYSSQLAALAGDVVRGKEVFAKKCSQCHKLEGIGHAVGPDLASLTDRSLPAMLTAILDPNRAIESKFVEYLAVTDDGRQHRGMLANETSTSLTLLAQEGKQETILRKELEELRSSGLSLMPVGLEKELPPQAMADVLAYLGVFRPPSKPFPGNKPELIETRDDGSIRTPATAARIYGPSIVFEEKYGNLGYWSSPEDRAAWDFAVRESGDYKVTLDFACSPEAAGNTLVLSVAGQKLSWKVPSTGSWDNYKGQELGRLTLAKGPNELSVSSEGHINGALIDLRSIRLIPTNAK